MRKGGSRVTLEQRAFLRFDSQQAKPRVKAWLMETLVEESGRSVAREELYHRYKTMCETERIESTTPSGFGRILRQVFPQISSRRLGPRNANKMHYHNVRFFTANPTTVDTPPARTPSPGLSSSWSSGCSTPLGSIATSPATTPVSSYGRPRASSPVPSAARSAPRCVFPAFPPWSDLILEDLPAPVEVVGLELTSYAHCSSPLVGADSRAAGLGLPRGQVHPWDAMPIATPMEPSLACVGAYGRRHLQERPSVEHYHLAALTMPGRSRPRR